MNKRIGTSVILMLTIRISLAFSSVPNYVEGATIYGCVSIGSGFLRIVDSPSQCKPNEKHISWSSTPTYVLRICPPFETPSGPWQCFCESDEMLISGGAECQYANQHLVFSYPSVWPYGGAWAAECADTDGPVAPQNVFVVCMKP